jgi:enamine deaminase RidA (YjgF/YER057c/UK114 family)
VAHAPGSGRDKSGREAIEMQIKRINTKNLTHRCDSVSWNGSVHLSGIMPSDESANVTGQTRQVLEEVENCLAAAGTDKSAIISATVWLADLNRDFAEFNAEWTAWVGGRNQPARSCVQAKLHGTGLLEVAVIAACPTT